MSTNSPQWPIILNWLNDKDSRPPLLLTNQNPAALATATTALALISACINSPIRACKNCSGCRQVLHASHPDTIVITSDTKTIPITSVRALLNTLSLAPQSNRRLVVIQQAHKLSIPASNALLKTLEEPAESTRFILTTIWPRRLLATIKSRCHHLRFSLALTTTALSTKYSGSLLERLSEAPKQPLTVEILGNIAAALNHQLHQPSITPELTRAYQRLRDYYLITNLGGNESVSKDVLLASLPTPH